MAAQDPIGFLDPLRQLFGFMTARRRRQLALVMGLMLAGALSELAVVGSVVPFLSFLVGDSGIGRFGWTTELFDRLGAHSQQSRIVAAASLFIATILVASAIRLQLAWSSQSFILRLGHDLSVEVQRRILLQPYAFHVRQNTSEIIASLEKIQVLVSGVLFQLMQTAAAAIIGLAIVVLLVSFDPFAALAALASLAVLYLLVSRFTGARLARNSEILGKSYGQRVKAIQEGLGGIRDLIIDHSQRVYLDEFRKIDDRFTRAQASTAFIAGAPRYVIEAAALIGIAGLAMLLAGREGGLARALPVLGALALGGIRLLPLLQQAFRGWAAMAGNRAVVGQILQLLRLPVSMVAEDEPSPLPFTRSIELESVTFTYPARPTPAIDRVSLTIPRGSRIALIGKTGSGKSTLADLVMALLEPDAGKIRIDGIELSAASRRSWQRNIAHVPQAIFLADASIARNIAFSVPDDAIDLERVRQAASIAELDELIASLPDGFDTIVGERGVRLSGGQRQRLGIARAAYKQAPLLILDEATNALDRETEAAVLRNLLADEDRTILIIAHRESTVAGCDRVMRLDKGRIVESG